MTAALEPVTLGLDVDGSQFRIDEELEARAGVVLGRFNELYPIAESITQGELRFGFLFNQKPFDVLSERFVCGSIGKSIKASPVWRDLAGFDAVVWVRQQIWDTFEADSQDALLLHLLLHFDATFAKGTWRLSTRDHDFAGFNDVARHFGSALPDIASFVRALQRGEAPVEQAVPIDMDAVLDRVVDEVNDGALGPNVTASRGRKPKRVHTGGNQFGPCPVCGGTGDYTADGTWGGGWTGEKTHVVCWRLKRGPEPPADVRALYGNLVRQGEALEQAAHRLADDTKAVGTTEGQRLLEVVNGGGGAEVPWPSEDLES